jgi:hypothetical protein
MRTTIILDDHLGECLKQEARKRKQSFSAFLADAGRQVLGETKKERAVDKFELVTYGEGGVMDGVDLNKPGALLTAADEEDYRT